MALPAVWVDKRWGPAGIWVWAFLAGWLAAIRQGVERYFNIISFPKLNIIRFDTFMMILPRFHYNKIFHFHFKI